MGKVVVLGAGQTPEALKITHAPADIPLIPPKETRDGMVEVTFTIPVGYKFEGDGVTARRKAPKVYPNQPCTCGSGKKAKHCHWKR